MNEPATSAHDVYAVRREIGFPPTREEWCASEAEYDADSLVIAGQPVMQDWQRDYMHTLADIAGGAGGAVLEVGYGMGLATRRLLANPDVTRQVLIECHPEVHARCTQEHRREIVAGRLTVVFGFWEDVVGLLAPGSFDGVLFDTCPVEEGQMASNHYPFFSAAHRLLRPGGRLTYFGDEVTDFSDDHRERLRAAGVEDLTAITCEVNPPEHPLYWPYPTIVAPIVVR